MHNLINLWDMANQYNNRECFKDVSVYQPNTKYYCILETTQAMLWFSSKSIIQKNGNIGIFQRALKLWEITASFISLHWKRQDNSNSFLIAATTWSYEP